MSVNEEQSADWLSESALKDIQELDLDDRARALVEAEQALRERLGSPSAPPAPSQ